MTIARSISLHFLFFHNTLHPRPAALHQHPPITPYSNPQHATSLRPSLSPTRLPHPAARPPMPFEHLQREEKIALPTCHGSLDRMEPVAIRHTSPALPCPALHTLPPPPRLQSRLVSSHLVSCPRNIPYIVTFLSVVSNCVGMYFLTCVCRTPRLASPRLTSPLLRLRPRPRPRARRPTGFATPHTHHTTPPGG